MDLNNTTGLIEGIRFCYSPNFNERPAGEKIELLVIHNISLPPGIFGTSDVEDFFTNQLKVEKAPFFEKIKDLTVSSHLFIRRTGEIIQFVPFTKRAWHAGPSSFLGRENCNDYSIGVELEGTDDLPYSSLQYEMLAKVTYLIMSHYPQITFDRIVGHSTIAPERKTDPGPSFDWNNYLDLVKALVNEQNRLTRYSR